MPVNTLMPECPPRGATLLDALLDEDEAWRDVGLLHYGCVNQLTDAVFDPKSRQPSYKACAVAARGIAYWEEEG